MGTFESARRAWHWLRRYGRDRRGNISSVVALLIIPLAGVIGIATETGNWFLIQRSAQNAADSAVLAAGQNDYINPSGTSYIAEGRSVASNFGFVNGASSTTVTPQKSQPCPLPLTGSNCYKVTITRSVPISLTRIVGYSGTGGTNTQSITATATAGPINIITEYCILSLSGSGTGIRINGGPNVNLAGCNIASNSSGASNPNQATNCNGQNPLGATVSAVGFADVNCGAAAYSGISPIADPYAHYATDNPGDLTDTCGGVYTPQNWNGVLTGAVTRRCGNQILTADITIGSGNNVIVIQNGSLDLNGHTISTTGTAGLSLVFNSPAGTADIVPFATNTGTLNYAAPTSGTWSGVAIYQNRANGSTAVTSQIYDGNKPTWDITGIVYMPWVDLQFKGIVNKSSSGYSCFVMVTYSLLISGNGAIYANPMSQCVQAGVTSPSNTVTTRITLIQ